MSNKSKLRRLVRAKHVQEQKMVPKMRSRLAVHSATLTHFATGDRWRLFLLIIQDRLYESESVSVIGLGPFCSSVVAGVPYSTSTGMKSGRVAFPSSISVCMGALQSQHQANSKVY